MRSQNRPGDAPHGLRRLAGLAALALSACAAEAVTRPASSIPDWGLVPPASPAGTTDVIFPALDGGPEPDGPLEPERSLRIMTFNIRHGEQSSLTAIAQVIRHEAPDLVGLQEVDVDAPRTGSDDQAYRLGQLTGMASIRRKAQDVPGGGMQCNALLSRFPIVGSSRIDLSSTGLPRMVLVVEVLVTPNTKLSVAVTHLGLNGVDRVKQAQQIIAALGATKHAVVVGDMNEKPHEPAATALAATFVDTWAAHSSDPGLTYPASVPAHRIDYVFLAKDWSPPSAAQVVDTKTSDHRPVVVTVPMPAFP